MAYIRTHETTARRNGKTVKRYEVCWTEPARDLKTGLPVTGKKRARQESYTSLAAAEERRDALNNAKHSVSGPGALADARKAAARTFAEYAADWLAAQKLKVAAGAMKQSTVDLYGDYLSRHALRVFGDRTVGSVTRADCERYLAALSDGGTASATRRLAFWTYSAVLDYAMHDGALPANPAKAVDRRAVPIAPPREHRPLTAAQVAAVAAKAAERSDVDELVVLFLCYTGLRKTEAQGLQVRDILLTTDKRGRLSGSVRVQRTAKRKAREWQPDTTKSKRSVRTVPLPPWLSQRLADYLADMHADSTNPVAPLFARRVRGAYRPDAEGNKRPTVKFDFSAPMDFDGWAKRVLRPALAECGLAGVRLHDTRHTFATLQLSAGVHFMQVSQWLGHASFTLTLNTYGEYVPEKDGGVPNALPEPVAARITNVVPMQRHG